MLSVIIPTLNSERLLVPTLAMLVPGAVSGIVRDVIVADGGSTDETVQIADMAGCVVLVSSAPLAARLRHAVAAARGSWLLFLRPGVVLDPNWLDEIARFVDASGGNRERSLAGVFRRAASPWTAHPLFAELMAFLASIMSAGPDPDQGLLIAVRLYKEIGGHRDDSAQPERELAARLGRRRIRTLRCGARR